MGRMAHGGIPCGQLCSRRSRRCDDNGNRSIPQAVAMAMAVAPERREGGEAFTISWCIECVP